MIQHTESFHDLFASISDNEYYGSAASVVEVLMTDPSARTDDPSATRDGDEQNN